MSEQRPSVSAGGKIVRGLAAPLDRRNCRDVCDGSEFGPFASAS